MRIFIGIKTIHRHHKHTLKDNYIIYFNQETGKLEEYRENGITLSYPTSYTKRLDNRMLDRLLRYLRNKKRIEKGLTTYQEIFKAEHRHYSNELVKRSNSKVKH